MQMQIRPMLVVGVQLALCVLPAAGFELTVVHPTGDPAQDVVAVRTAVQAGGTVLLRATNAEGVPQAFDFGSFPVGAADFDPSGSGYVALGTSGELVLVTVGDDSRYVSLGNDVRLLGETTHGATTTIRGGNIPIRNFEPRTVPGAGEQMVFGIAKLTVEGIRFTESALQSIYTQQLGALPEVQALVQERKLRPRTEIRRNAFHDVKPAYAGAWYSLAAVTDGPAGAVKVEDNLVQLTPGRWDAEERAYEQANGLDPAFEVWEGISIANLHARGDVTRNRVSGVDVGLLVYFEGRDFVRIAENHVRVRSEGLVGIGCQANHQYLIERNTVIADGSNPDGIYLSATDQVTGINRSTVRYNHVVMNGSEYGAISLFGAGTFNAFVGNRVEGSAAYALGLVADFFSPDPIAKANRFLGNQISRFTPRDSAVYGSGAHVFFDANTRRNRFIGWSGTVKDLGQDNVFIP
jgi:hypothetical protein